MTDKQALRTAWSKELLDFMYDSSRAHGDTRADEAAWLDHATVLIDAYTEQSVEQHFQAIVPDEGPLEDTKGTYADGYAQAVKDVCNAHYATLKGDNHE